MNTCTICLEEKPLGDFPVDRAMKSGYKNQCKACRYANRTADPNQRAKKYATHKKWRFKAKYGITPEMYDQMWLLQGGVCAICKEPERVPGRSLAVDHDHVTGQARKLLCSECNLMIGNSGENPEVLEAGARYIRAMQARGFSTPRDRG
jgi:hypothetical protein